MFNTNQMHLLLPTAACAEMAATQVFGKEVKEKGFFKLLNTILKHRFLF